MHTNESGVMFPKLRKGAVGFVRPHGTTGLPVDRCSYLGIFLNSVDKIQVLLKLSRITGTLREDASAFLIMSVIS